MLDICSCKCFVNAPKSQIKLELCQCDKTLKIPAEEIEFYIDQKFDRGMHITSYKDLKTSKKYAQQKSKLTRRLQRKEPQKIQKQVARESSNFESIDPTTTDFAATYDLDPDDPIDTMGASSSENKKPFQVRNTRDYKCFLSYAERLGLKDNAIAGLINSLNVDYGIHDPRFYTCEGKIRHLKQKYGSERTKSHYDNDYLLQCSYHVCYKG